MRSCDYDMRGVGYALAPFKGGCKIFVSGSNKTKASQKFVRVCAKPAAQKGRGQTGRHSCLRSSIIP